MYAVTGNSVPIFGWLKSADRQFSRTVPVSRFWLSDIIFWAIFIYFIYLITTSNMETAYIIGLIILFILLPFVCVFPMLALYNQIVYLFCTNPPMRLNKDLYFPGHTVFENKHNFSLIKKEVTNAIKSDELKCFHEHQATDLDNNTKKTCWKWLPLLDQKGWHKDAIKSMPTLAKLIKDNKQIVSAAISVIEPGMGIPEHKGYLQSILRYHLGVLIPTDANPYIVCGGEKYFWKEGEGVMFDDMYLHHVMNPSKHRRAIIWLDIHRNDLPWPMDTIITNIYDGISSMVSLKAYDQKLHEQKNIKSEIDEEGNRTETFI